MRRGSRAGLLAALALPLACVVNPHREGTWLQGPGAGDDLEAAGPWGVAQHRLWAPARYSDMVVAEVFYPASEDGFIDPTGGPHPLILLIQEEGQPAPGFQWLSVHLASWGFVVAVPKHLRDDPGLASDNASWVRARIHDIAADEGTFLYGGVDGGADGLVRFQATGDAIQGLDEDTAWGTLALVAAEPHSPSTSQIPGPVLSVAAERDCVADATVGWDNYTAQRYRITALGMSHGQLVDEATGGTGVDGESDCTEGDATCDPTVCDPTIDDALARQRVAAVITAFEAAFLRPGGDPDYPGAISGVEDIEILEGTPAPEPTPVTASGPAR